MAPSTAIYRHRRLFTSAQERQHRERTALCRRRIDRLTPGDRQFIGEAARLHGNLDVTSADRLALIVERLFWLDRDGAASC